MTIEETILSFPGLEDFSSVFLKQILKARALDGASESTVADVQVVNLAIADTLCFAVNMPDYTENKLSEKYPRPYFLKTAAMLYRKNGEEAKADAIEIKKRKVKIPRGKAPKSW